MPTRRMQPRTEYRHFAAPDYDGRDMVVPLTVFQSLDISSVENSVMAPVMTSFDDWVVDDWAVDSDIYDMQSDTSERTIRPPRAPPSTRVASSEALDMTALDQTRMTSFSSTDSVPSMIEDLSSSPSDSDSERRPEDRWRSERPYQSRVPFRTTLGQMNEPFDEPENQGARFDPPREDRFPKDQHKRDTARRQLCQATSASADRGICVRCHGPLVTDTAQLGAPQPLPEQDFEQQLAPSLPRNKLYRSLSGAPSLEHLLQAAPSFDEQQKTFYPLQKTGSRPCLSDPMHPVSPFPPPLRKMKSQPCLPDPSAQVAPPIPSSVQVAPQKMFLTHSRDRHRNAVSNPLQLPPPPPPPATASSWSLPLVPPPNMPLPPLPLISLEEAAAKMSLAKTQNSGRNRGTPNPIPDQSYHGLPLHRGYAKRIPRGKHNLPTSEQCSPTEHMEIHPAASSSKRSKSQPPISSPRRRQQLYHDAPSYERPLTSPVRVNKPCSFNSTPPLPYVIEKSTFDYDTEDEKPRRLRAASSPLHSTTSSALASKLHIRNLSLGSRRIGFSSSSKKDKSGYYHKAGSPSFSSSSSQANGRRRSATQIVKDVLGLRKK